LVLDADDYLHPDALQRMYDVIKVEGGFVYTDFFKPEDDYAVFTPHDFECSEVLHKLPYPVTCMYERIALRNADIWFDEVYQTGWEDWDFALQVIAKAGICGTHISAPLWHYRIHTGTLREMAYARRDTLKNVVYERWADYITGKKENMGCGCGGRRGASLNVYASQVAPNTQADATEGDTLLLEFVGDDSGSRRTFIGRATGNRYRFSNDTEHRVRRVFTKDVEHLMGSGMFRLFTGPTESGTEMKPLAAAGPPKRG
jgi:hypothetical protein